MTLRHKQTVVHADAREVEVQLTVLHQPAHDVLLGVLHTKTKSKGE